jgi:hypothetical protein
MRRSYCRRGTGSIFAAFIALAVAACAHQPKGDAALQSDLISRTVGRQVRYQPDPECANDKWVSDPLVVALRAIRTDADTVAESGVEPLTQVSEISMSRTACLGTCPSYTVSFRKSGAVTYEGYACVPFPGRRSGHIDPIQFAHLGRLAEEIGFCELKSAYVSSITDQAAVFIKVHRPGKSKVVMSYAGAGPDRLQAFDVMLHRTYGTITWDPPGPSK